MSKALLNLSADFVSITTKMGLDPQQIAAASIADDEAIALAKAAEVLAPRDANGLTATEARIVAATGVDPAAFAAAKLDVPGKRQS